MVVLAFVFGFFVGFLACAYLVVEFMERAGFMVDHKIIDLKGESHAQKRSE